MLKKMMGLLVIVLAFILTPYIGNAELVAHYKFNGDVNDSANSYHGSVIGNPVYVEGIEGQAIKFSGIGDYISLPNDTLSSVNDQITIAFWVLGDASQPVSDYAFEAGEDSISKLKITLPDYDGMVYFDSQSDQIVRNADTCWWKESWTHWAFVKDSSSGIMSMYRNGMRVVHEMGNTADISDINNINIGALINGTGCYSGAMDDFRIYNSALNIEMINEIYINGRATNPTPAEGSNYVSVDNSSPTLRWVASPEAISHDIYFGTSYSSVHQATTLADEYKGNQTSSYYVPNENWINNTKYYWRVDQVTAGGTVKGQVWSFVYDTLDCKAFENKGYEAVKLIERDFRILSYDGYYEDNQSPAWAYAWPNSIYLMALANAAQINPTMYNDRINNFITQMEDYWTTEYGIGGYDCLPNPSATNRFYDDNSWKAVALAKAYKATGNQTHLEKAIAAYDFTLTGEDNVQGGGLYWKETQYPGDPEPVKGISSTAGAAHAAALLYEITGDNKYKTDADRLLDWIMDTLEDEDGIILNCINADTGFINRTKWTYNIGVPISAYSILYTATQDNDYKTKALELAQAAQRMYFNPANGTIIDISPFAFTLAESWIDLYHITDDKHWLGLAHKSIKFVYENRDSNGRYGMTWNEELSEDVTYWGLLYSAPAVSAYWKMANVRGREKYMERNIDSSNITVTASSTYSGLSPSNTIDGLGIAFYQHDNCVTASTMWHSAVGGGGDQNLHPDTATGAAWIKYEFDKAYNLGRMWIWNHNQLGATSRGLRNVIIEYSEDGNTWTKLGDYEFERASGALSNPHNEEIDFEGASAKYVVITAKDENGNWGDGGLYYGLSEVRFGIFGTRNIASEATVTSSSEYSSDYAAIKAVDGIIGIHANGEWASNGETNPWVKLEWSNNQRIDKIVLFDRSNNVDNVNEGVLRFSDSSTINITDIPTDGKAKEISFSDKEVTWLEFEVTGGIGSNVGLSEIQVFSSNGLVAWYKCNDGSGDTLRDSSINKYDATGYEVTWNGGAVELNGSDAYISIPLETLFDVNKEISVSLWQYGREQTYNTLLEAINSSSQRLLNVHLPWYGEIYWDTAITDSISKTCSTSDTQGEWIHWLFTKNASTGYQKIYRNGLLWHSEASLTGEINGNTAYAFKIGSDVAGNYNYDGLLDDIRIYDKELSEREVYKLYINGAQ